MTEGLKDQIDALRDLQQHPGWQIVRDAIVKEITGDFETHITKALDHPDGAVALDRMRQVAAVRAAGMRWLKLPQETLARLMAQAQADEPQVSRRPNGL